MFYLDFEEKLEKFDIEIQSLIKLSKESEIDVDGKINSIEKKKQIELNRIYSNLSPWQIVKLARHPSRPKTKNFINSIFFLNIRSIKYIIHYFLKLLHEKLRKLYRIESDSLYRLIDLKCYRSA